VEEPEQLESRQNEQGKDGDRKKLSKVAPHIDDQQAVRIRGKARCSEKCRESRIRQFAAKARSRKPRECLDRHDEDDGGRLPRDECSEKRAEKPRQRWIENKSGSPNPKICEFGHRGKRIPLLPLSRHVEPRSHVKSNVVA